MPLIPFTIGTLIGGALVYLLKKERQKIKKEK